ncbi:alpha-1,2-fucosyltransferase [Olivibacter sitiensis]|uniref:alpha-1,2-fucosyltransferase n=1 Tax=Olivibacter sitiensis TaxID=376470 RepID=UPI00048142F0|nr:alpha-1,2-fucosyltransferase [Olivibacter sitiensis]
MIGVEFKGRLGNQLFQYCFWRYLKQKNPKKYYFFLYPNHAYFQRYFYIGWLPNMLFHTKLYTLITKLITQIFTFKHIYHVNFLAPKPVEPGYREIYHGYWQTDYYYRQLEERNKPRLKRKYITLFNDSYGKYFFDDAKKNIAVHIRLTDYKNHYKRDLSLPMTYYERQLKELGDLDSYRIFFVSDDIATVKSFFGNRQNYFYSNNSEIIDFQIIMNADIAIISNSTFSWWAAYLSTKKGQQVIAPKYFLGFRMGKEFPKGIMTTKFRWKTVE